MTKLEGKIDNIDSKLDTHFEKLAERIKHQDEKFTERLLNEIKERQELEKKHNAVANDVNSLKSLKKVIVGVSSAIGFIIGASWTIFTFVYNSLKK